MPTVEKIFPENIRLDGNTQPRAKIDQCLCDEYGEQMKAGDEFPAIDVYFDGENYWLVDGFHRLQGRMMALPGEAILCNVYRGTLADAQWHSYSVNKSHGLRRSNEDKQRAVNFALAHPAAEDKSNVQVADHCGVSEFLVRKCRKRLTSIESKSDVDTVSTSTVSKSRPRTGRDGRTINTAKIGRAKKGRTGSKPSPAVSARIAQPTRKPKPMDKMTAINMPHDPYMGAMTLIELFDADYLHSLLNTISKHLKELPK